MKEKIIIICLFVELLFGASISGYVKDATDGEVLPFADVYINGQPYGASTNNKGFFIIDGLPQGKYDLITSYLGYEPVRQIIIIINENKFLGDIKLSPSAQRADEVVVEARREGGEKDLLTGHTILSPTTIKYMPHLIEADLFRSMHLLPGITSTSDFSSALYIWGSVPAHNLVLMDGIEVYNATHLGGAMSAFTVDAVKDINLIKGGFPAKYGGRVGSVLEILNREGDRSEIHGSGEISLLSSHITFYGPMPQIAGSGTWMFSGRRTYYDVVTAALEGVGLIEDDFPYHFTDLHGKITRDLNGGDKLAISLYHGSDVLNFKEEDDATDFRWGNTTVSSNYMHLFTPKLFGNFMLAYSRFGERLKTVDNGSTDFIYEDFVNDVTARGSVITTKPNHTLEAGAEAKFMSIQNGNEDFSLSTGDIEWNSKTLIFSLYAQDEYKPNILWTYEYGARAEISTKGPFARIAPRFSAMRRLDDKNRLKAAGGLYYQYFQSVPKFEDMGLSFFETWVLSQEDLPPSWATHLVLRYETENIANIPITVDAYYKYMGNIYKHKLQWYDDDRFADLFHIGDGFASGIDVQAKFENMSWTGWISYSFSLTVNKFESINEGKPFYPKHDKRHNASVFLARDLGHGWATSATFSLNSGMPYTQPVGYYLSPGYSFSGGEPYFYPDEYMAGIYNMRVPMYHRLDVGISKRSRFYAIDTEFYFQIINLYNHKNVYTYFIDVYPEEGRVEKDPMTQLPIIPTFGIRGWF